MTPFSKILDSSWAWTIFIFIWNYWSCCSKIVYSLLNSCIIAEAAAVIPNGAKTFFAKGIATFINGPANLLNNDPKNPPD